VRNLALVAVLLLMTGCGLSYRGEDLLARCEHGIDEVAAKGYGLSGNPGVCPSKAEGSPKPIVVEPAQRELEILRLEGHEAQALELEQALAREKALKMQEPVPAPEPSAREPVAVPQVPPFPTPFPTPMGSPSQP
jgi:hypothetical protein